MVTDYPEYHSAHYFERPADPIPYHSTARGVALYHDIASGLPLPEQYQQCDILYADLPWRTGFTEFNRRAGVTGDRSYQELLTAVSAIVEQAPRAVLVTGKHAGPWLPLADRVMPVRLNEHAALAYLYRTSAQPVASAPELLSQLAARYRCVGDFCCGYGNSGRIFAQAGKRYVLSDHNPRCIGHIATHADTWTERGAMFNRNEIVDPDAKPARVAHHWSRMEEYHPDGGMWQIPKGLDRQRFVDDSANLMRNPDAFYAAMARAVREWPRSCETAFTTPGLNRRAWIGHAGCYLATGSPEETTRLGWHQLTPEEQHAANAAADHALNYWSHRYTKANPNHNERGLW